MPLPAFAVTAPLLAVSRLEARFGKIDVLDKVSFEINRGETVGLVGESGCGKSTLARAVLRLIPVCGGAVWWQGKNLLHLSGKAMRAHRRDMQLIFQDALASLDPRMTIGTILAEPLRIFEATLSSHQRAMRIAAMLDRVGLSGDVQNRHPHEFSGGQCQRIGIARAMMSRPALLICDEAVSSLDVSVQGQIVNLLFDLQSEYGMAMLFISHNMAVVRHVSHRILVMHRGRVVESADRDKLFARPRHPYTRKLLAAIPDIRSFQDDNA